MTGWIQVHLAAESAAESQEETNLKRPNDRHAHLTLAESGLHRSEAQRQTTHRSRLPDPEESLNQTIEWDVTSAALPRRSSHG